MSDTASHRLTAYLQSYSSARQEIIERIKQRDLLYSYYLVAVGGLAGIRAIGFAIESYNKDTLVSYFEIPIAPLTLYPFLAIFFCTILSQHQIQIGKLGYLCDIALSRGKIKEIIGEKFSNWETELIEYKLPTLNYFKLAHFLLFILPSLLACLSQTTLLYLSFVPKWHGLRPASDLPSAIQQYVSLISVSVLNLISWYFLYVTIYTLFQAQRDRDSLEAARAQISDCPTTDISKIEAQTFVKRPKHVSVFSVKMAMLFTLLASLFAHYITYSNRGSFKITQPPASTAPGGK